MASKVTLSVTASVPPLTEIWSAVVDTGAAPSPLFPEIDSVPAMIDVLPVYVFAPERVQVPVPDLVTDVTLPLLTIAPATSPLPSVEPLSVSVFGPFPVAVKSLVNFSNPVPD